MKLLLLLALLLVLAVHLHTEVRAQEQSAEEIQNLAQVGNSRLAAIYCVTAETVSPIVSITKSGR